MRPFLFQDLVKRNVKSRPVRGTLEQTCTRIKFNLFMKVFSLRILASSEAIDMISPTIKCRIPEVCYDGDAYIVHKRILALSLCIWQGFPSCLDQFLQNL